MQKFFNSIEAHLKAAELTKSTGNVHHVQPSPGPNKTTLFIVTEKGANKKPKVMA